MLTNFANILNLYSIHTIKIVFKKYVAMERV